MARLKIYTDENADIRIAEGLKRRGIKAFPAHEKDMIGASDIEHFKYASKIKAVIFTHDQHCPVKFLRVLFHCSKAVIPACFWRESRMVEPLDTR